MQYRRNETDRGKRRRGGRGALGVHVDRGLRIAVLTFQMSGVYLIQKGAWWKSAVNLMVLVCSVALLLKTTCTITLEIFELDALNLQLPMTIRLCLN